MSDEYLTNLTAALKERVDEANREGKTLLAKKWANELRILTLPGHVKVLEELNVAPENLGNIPVYAAVKARRMISAFIGAGVADPFTKAIIENSKSGETNAKVHLAALSKDVRNAAELAVRRNGAVTTASTQASSTRAALAALGVGTIIANGRDRVLRLNMEHPLMKKVFS